MANVKLFEAETKKTKLLNKLETLKQQKIDLKNEYEILEQSKEKLEKENVDLENSFQKLSLDVEEKEKLQVPEDISHMQDEISEDKTTESEVLDYETSENETSDVETANTEISEKTSDSENADEAVWFEAYKPEEEPQISEWAAPVAETVEVEPEEDVQEEPEAETLLGTDIEI